MSQSGLETKVMPVPDVPDTLAIVVKGRVTHEQAPRLRKTILDQLKKGSATRFVIELAIALSIAYVAAENLLQKGARTAWPEALGFEGGDTPGNCKTLEECNSYCADLANNEECMAFMSGTDFKKTSSKWRFFLLLIVNFQR